MEIGIGIGVASGKAPSPGGAESVGTTWDAANKHSTITLSGDDLVATRASSGGSYRNVRSVASKASGKYYVEFPSVVWASGDSVGVGITNAGDDFTTSSGYLGNLTANGAGMFAASTVSRFYVNGGNTTLGAHTSGQSVDLSIDIDTETIGVRINNGSWTDFSFAAANAGPWYLAATVFSLNDAVTMITTEADWERTPRSGFGEWSAD